jgi:hypothetical protein
MNRRDFLSASSRVLASAAFVSLSPAIATKAVAAPASVIRDANTGVALYNPCTDETITLYGRLTMVVIPKDGLYQGNIVYSMEGMGSDGTVYRLNYTQPTSLNIGPGLEQTQLLQYQLVSRGPGPNLQVKMLFHWTWNANFEMTSFVNSGEVICR